MALPTDFKLPDNWRPEGPPEYLFQDPLDQQSAAGTQQYRTVLAGQQYDYSERRTPAKLLAEAPAVHLYGQAEVAGTILWAGPRSWVRKFTKGTNYASDPTDYTLADDTIYSLQNELNNLGDVPGDNLAVRYLASRTGFSDLGAYATGDFAAINRRAKWNLGSTYDMIVALSEGTLETWPSTIEMFVSQPPQGSFEMAEAITLHHRTANLRDPVSGTRVQRVWYEPAAYTDGDAVSKVVAGRLRVIPYLQGDASNPIPWSTAFCTFDVRQERYNLAGQKISGPSSVGLYRHPWTDKHRAKGISYVHIIYANSLLGAWLDPGYTTQHTDGISTPTQSRAPHYGNAWQGQPTFRLRTKGKKFWRPGLATDTKEWTDNAAAVRYDVERHLRGVAAGDIDEASVQAAITVCDENIQLQYAASPYANVPSSQGGLFDRYTVNGEIEATQSHGRRDQELDFLWQGATQLVNGKLKFFPGKLPAAVATLTRDDIASIGRATLTPPIATRFNRLVEGAVEQDRFRAWSEIPLPEIVNTALASKDGRALRKSIGVLRLCDNYFRGLYLLHLAANRTWMRESFALTLTPGGATKLQNIVPGMVLDWNVDADLETPFDIWQYKEANQTYPRLWVRDVQNNARNRTVSLVVSPLKEDIFAPSLRIGQDPGDLTTVVDALVDTERHTAVPLNATITPFLDQLKDGTWINGFSATWTNAYSAVGTEIRLTPTTGTALHYEQGGGATRMRQVDIPDGTYTAAIRHIFPPAQGSAVNTYGPWHDLGIITLGRDTTAPAAPTNVTATALFDTGILVKWDASDASDYAYTKVTISPDAAEQVAGTEIILYPSDDGNLTVSVQHVDTSGNESAATTATVYRPTETLFPSGKPTVDTNDFEWGETTFPSPFVRGQEVAAGVNPFVLPQATYAGNNHEWLYPGWYEGIGYEYAVHDGLPRGMSFDAATRAVTGTPEEGGSHETILTVIATPYFVPTRIQDLWSVSGSTGTATVSNVSINDNGEVTAVSLRNVSGYPPNATFGLTFTQTFPGGISGSFSLSVTTTNSGSIYDSTLYNFGLKRPRSSDTLSRFLPPPPKPVIIAEKGRGAVVGYIQTDSDGRLKNVFLSNGGRDFDDGTNVEGNRVWIQQGAAIQQIVWPVHNGGLATTFIVPKKNNKLPYPQQYRGTHSIDYYISEELATYPPTPATDPGPFEFGAAVIPDPLVRRTPLAAGSFVLPTVTRDNLAVAATYAVVGLLPNGVVFTASTRRITGLFRTGGNHSILYKATARDLFNTTPIPIVTTKEGGKGFGARIKSFSLAAGGTAISQVEWASPGDDYQVGDVLVFTQGNSRAEYTLVANDIVVSRQLKDFKTGSGNAGTKTIRGVQRIGYSRYDFYVEEPTIEFGAATIGELVKNQAIGATAFRLPTVTINDSAPATGLVRYEVVNPLPNGMTFDPATRYVGGTPTVAGNYELIYKATYLGRFYGSGATPTIVGGSGSGATIASYTVDSQGRLTAINVSSGGSGYRANDQITIRQTLSSGYEIDAPYTLQSSDLTSGAINNLTGKTITPVGLVAYDHINYKIDEPAGNSAFDINGLTAVAIASADYIPFADASDSNKNKKTSIANLKSALDVPDVPDAPGNQNAAAKYVLNVPANSGDATWVVASDFDIHDLTVATIADADKVPFSDESAVGDPNRATTFANFKSALAIPNLPTAPANQNVKTAYVLSVPASSGSATWETASSSAFDINALTTATISSADFIPFSDESETGDPNRKTTIANLKTALDIDEFSPGNTGTTGQVLTKTGQGYQWQAAGSDFDISDLTTATIASADKIPFSDESASGDPNRATTFSNFKSALAIPNLPTAPANQNVATSYVLQVPASSGAATWVTASSSAFDIHALTTATISSADFIPFSDENVSGDPNRKTSIASLKSALDIDEFSPGNTGSSGQYLQKQGVGYQWRTIPTYTSFAPSNSGSTGQVLTKTSSGYNWQAAGSAFDIHDDVTTSATIASSDRIIFSDEGTGGDPMRYTTFANFKSALNLTSFSPSNSGSTGQVLTKTSSGYNWANAPAATMDIDGLSGQIYSNDLTTSDLLAVSDQSASGDPTVKVSLASLRLYIRDYIHNQLALSVQTTQGGKVLRVKIGSSNAWKTVNL